VNFYPVTSLLRLSVAFTDAATSAAVDPSTVTLLLTRPDGTAETHLADVYRDDTGAYHLDVTVDQAGTWRYRWEGAGRAVAATPVIAFGAG
jgi:hypothetical protein